MLYVNHNNEAIITYQADIPRPLASVVKIIIAIEYAYQMSSGDISKDQTVALNTLNRYYIENTDGGHHEEWINHLKKENNIHNEEVPIHDVTRGMITFSSNANTDYLIDLLGVENINARINELELIDHDDVYPLVGALLTSHEYKQKGDKDWLQQLGSMSAEESIFTRLI